MARPKLAVFKFASCDGCQLSLLDAEDELLAVASAVDLAFFLEARTAVEPGPYDIGLVEGSITNEHDAERIKQIRRQCKMLVTIGACATAGGIQALKNWADADQYVRAVYAAPEYIQTLATSTPISEHVWVDHELRGCPIAKEQLLEFLTCVLLGKRPRADRSSVCVECKRRGTVCVAVTRGLPCLGPVTQNGCGALCPAHGRGCYGCFGPKEQSNLPSLSTHYQCQGVSDESLIHLTRNFNGYAPEFREVSTAIEQTGSAVAVELPR
jgi:coenzyme F420-reducing hydrogenase gamma subunit